MFGIGTGELLLLLVIALVVLGPERMPKLARDVGRALGDLRRTSDDLRAEFLNADKVIDAAARQAERSAVQTPATPADVGAAADAPQPSATVDAPVPDQGATQAAVDPAGRAEEAASEASPAQAIGEVETDFDRDARLARERLDDPERAKRAAAEGWKVPTDEAGTNTERWG